MRLTRSRSRVRGRLAVLARPAASEALLLIALASCLAVAATVDIGLVRAAAAAGAPPAVIGRFAGISAATGQVLNPPAPKQLNAAFLILDDRASSEIGLWNRIAGQFPAVEWIGICGGPACVAAGRVHPGARKFRLLAFGEAGTEVALGLLRRKGRFALLSAQGVVLARPRVPNAEPQLRRLGEEIALLERERAK